MSSRSLKRLGRVMTTESRTFAIPELLENILFHLPERDLLLAQRVNRSFRDVLNASVHLQRKLFLTADIESEDGLATKLKLNPFIDISIPKDCELELFYLCKWLDPNANVENRCMIPIGDFVCDRQNP